MLLVTQAPEGHARLAHELTRHGVHVMLLHHSAPPGPEFPGEGDLVLVDLATADLLDPAVIDRLNSRTRRSPVLGLCDGPWPAFGPRASRLRVDGLATSSDSHLIALAAGAASAAARSITAH